MWRTGLVAPRHVGSSQIRDRTHVPCIGRRILNHCTSREVLSLFSDLSDGNRESRGLIGWSGEVISVRVLEPSRYSQTSVLSPSP